MARQMVEDKEYPYIENTKADVRLLGCDVLLSPLMDKTSSQRNMMLSHHAPQAQGIHGAEQPRLMSGFESMIGQYEYNTTKRENGIQVLEPIPRFILNSGMYPLKKNPFYTIVYRDDKTGQVGYFNLEKYTMRSNGYGYENKWMNTQQLNKGNYIPPDLKLCTSPSHFGNMYMMGTNLRTAYMSLPQVTEDAFVISESAAKKLGTTSIGRLSFKILPNQIPKNLYGDDDEYKFMPDIGETVHEDGVFCAVCTPTQDSFIADMSKSNLCRVQHLHDTVFYLPPGAEIIDVDIFVNRKCKIKTPPEMFTQVKKYRDQINRYNITIWQAYQNAIKEGWEITPAFNTLVTRAIGNLLADNIRIPGYSKRADVSWVKRKEAIEFLYITVTYKKTTPVSLGWKCSNR